MQDKEFERQKALAYDESNVTDTNPLIDLLKIMTQLVLILCVIYFSIFISLGIVIKTMSDEKQAKIENAISIMVKDDKNVATKEEQQRLNKIKQKILSADKKFPKTSKLDMGIAKEKQLNAWCYPNGSIYITSSLYEKLKDDEELTFVLAHEMGHYKNRDHLMSLRKNISSAAVLLFMSVVSPSNGDAAKIVSGTMNASDLHYSRGVEMKADNYAKSILKRIYGNTNGGVRALEVLDKEKLIHFDLASTHPDTRKRIENLKKK